MVACIMTVKSLGPNLYPLLTGHACSIFAFGFMTSRRSDSLEQASIELNLQFRHK